MSFNPRPVIGINVDLVPACKTAGSFIRLATGYFDSVYNAGGLPILIPPLNKEAEIDAILDRVDGVVLCGGPDLDPRRMNQPMHASVVPMSPRREDNDRILVRRIFDREIPVLGIGVGMQQINVHCGGTLYSHLPEDMPKAMPHFDPSGGPHRHLVLLEPNTVIDEIYGGGEIRINSAHHQAVKTVGRGLRIGSKSPDDVIESIETIDSDWFCVGVQWHPESETASALDMQLFECFTQAAMRQAPTLKLVA